MNLIAAESPGCSSRMQAWSTLRWSHKRSATLFENKAAKCSSGPKSLAYVDGRIESSSKRRGATSSASC